MLPLPPKFLSEIEKAAYHPFALLTINGDGQSDEATTQADWTDKIKSEANIDYGGTFRDLTSATYKWTASGSGTNEYYLEIAAGGDPGIVPPVNLSLNLTPASANPSMATEGTAGALNDHEWDWNDNDSLGYNTVYFRDDTGDPDTSGIDLIDPGNAPTPGDVIIKRDGSGSDTATDYPTADVTQGNWTANVGDRYAAIAEVSHDSDTTYISTTTNSDSYLASSPVVANIISDLPDNCHIVAVKVITVSRIESGSSMTGGKSLLTFDGTTYESNFSITPTTSYVERSADFTYAPNGAPWRKDDIEAITSFGIKSGTITGGGAYRVTQIKLVVQYWDFNSSGNGTWQFDLGASAVTSNKAIISIDDLVPSGCTLVYTAEGSTTGLWGGEEVNLGSVSDGTEMTGYRYYRITATMTTSNTTGTTAQTPVLKTIKIELPDNVYKFSTLTNYVLSAMPLLKNIPSRNIKLSLKDFVTDTSSMTVTLTRTDFTDNMLRAEYFRGLSATIQIGMYYDGITMQDLIPYYQGTVTNYSINDEEISIPLKDATKDLSLKWPIAGAGTTKPSEDKDGTLMVQVIEDIIDDLGISSRYVDRGSFNNVRNNVGDGTPAPVLYKVKRVSGTAITEQDTGKKIIGELCELLGAFLVIQENGKLQLIEYDNSATSVDTWDDNIISSGATYSPGLESLRNIVYLYFDWDGTGTDGADFSSINVTVDATSVSNWGITSSKIIKSKWLAGTAADGYHGSVLAAEIAAREVARLKDGVGIFKCVTSLSRAGVQVGDMVTVDSSLIINPDVGLDDTRAMLVTSKNWDVGSGIISWELTEAR